MCRCMRKFGHRWESQHRRLGPSTITTVTPLNLQPMYPNDNIPKPQVDMPPSLPLQNQPTRFSFEEHVIEQNSNTNSNVSVSADTQIPKDNRFQRPMQRPMPIIVKSTAAPYYDYSSLSVPEIIKQNLSLKQLMEHSLIAKLIKDGAGSRFIQEKLKNAQTMHDVLRHLIFTEHEVLQCSTSKYGNYVMQKFFEHGDAAAQ